MLFTGLGWKEIPAPPEYSEWTDFDSPKKILKGVQLNVSTTPGTKFKVSVDGESVPFKLYPGSVVTSSISIPWPTWANNSLVSPSLFSEPAPPPPKKPDPEPMDLTSKRRISLNE